MPAARYESWGLSRQRLGPVTAGTSGEAIIKSDPVKDGHRWRISALTIYSDQAPAGTVSLYVGDCEAIGVHELELENLTANWDRVDGVTTVVWVLGGERFMLVWFGQTPGTVVQCRYLVEDFQESMRPVDRTLMAY